MSSRSAVVTGGSSGIGLEVMRELAGAGITCYDFSRSSGVNVQVESEVRRAYESMTDVPDFLIANAGISQPGEPFPRDDPDNWYDMMATNLDGVYTCCREHARRLIEARKPGRFVIVSSSSARRPSMENLGYGVSKAAVESLGLALAHGLEPHGIKVFVLQPAFVDTPMLRARWGAGVLEHALITPRQFAREVARYLIEDTYADGHVISYGAEVWMKQR